MDAALIASWIQALVRFILRQVPDSSSTLAPKVPPLFRMVMLMLTARFATANAQAVMLKRMMEPRHPLKWEANFWRCFDWGILGSVLLLRLCPHQCHGKSNEVSY